MFIITACSNCGNKPARTRHGIEYTPIKVCAIGSIDNSGCVTYEAVDYSFSTHTLIIKTTDDRKLIFNNAGWAFIIVKK